MIKENLKTKLFFYIRIFAPLLFIFLIFFSIKNFYPFFLCLNIILFFQFIFFKIKKPSNIQLLLISIFLTVIVCEFVLSFFFKQNINPGTYDKPISAMNSYDQDHLGYSPKDGEYNYKFFINVNNNKKLLFENEYIIKRNMRVANKEQNINQCPKFIFLGGSHNFGQGLDFNNTIQGFLEKKGNTMNLSAPVYGLNHSISRLISEEKFLSKNCNEKDKKYIIYRYMFMSGHLPRNAGFHSYNKYGPDFREEKLNIYLKNLEEDQITVTSYCSNFYYCLKYNFNYFLHRIVVTFTYSETFTGKIIGEYIEKFFFSKKYSLSHSINLSNFLNQYIKKKNPNDQLIIYVENLIYKKNKDPYKFKNSDIIEDISANIYYDELKKNNDILMIKTNKISFINECINLYIAYEGHPSKCQNEKVSNEILKLIKF